MKLVAKRAELVQKFVPRSRVKIFRNEGMRSTPLDPKPMFFCVSYYLTRSRGRLFRNEGTLATRLDHKLIFWYISYNLGAFGTVWPRYKTRCKTGRTSAKVRATKSRRNFSQRTHLIHPIGPKTDVLVRISYHLVAFGTVWLPYETRCKTGRTSAKVRAMKSRRNFSQRKHPPGAFVAK